MQRRLEAAGIPVWRDTTRLRPGQDWPSVIRSAITDNALVFIACFSRSSTGRAVSYQNEELTEAIDQLRQRQPGDPWLIPVRFDECDIPEVDIGGGRTLRSLQRADLFGGKARREYARLLATIERILEGTATPPRPARRRAALAWLAAAIVVATATGVTLLAILPGKAHPGPAPPSRPGAGAAGRTTGTTRQPPRGARLVAASFPAPGSGPTALTFDGRDLWMTDDSDTIFQVDPAGQIDASYQSPAPTPEGLAWDGRSFWVFTTDHGLIYHFRIRSGQVQVLGSINPHSQVFGGDITHNLAWASPGLWWAEQYTLTLLSTRGTVIGQKVTKGSNITGLAWDGGHLWLGYDNFPNGSRIEEDTSNGTTIRAFTVPITSLTALAWADQTLWALGQDQLGGTTRIYRLRLPAR